MQQCLIYKRSLNHWSFPKKKSWFSHSKRNFDVFILRAIKAIIKTQGYNLIENFKDCLFKSINFSSRILFILNWKISRTVEIWKIYSPFCCSAALLPEVNATRSEFWMSVSIAYHFMTLFIPAQLIYTGGGTGSGLQLSHLFCFLFINAKLFINMRP